MHAEREGGNIRGMASEIPRNGGGALRIDPFPEGTGGSSRGGSDRNTSAFNRKTHCGSWPWRRDCGKPSGESAVVVDVVDFVDTERSMCAARGTLGSARVCEKTANLRRGTRNRIGQ